MLLIADVHGASRALREVAARGETLLVLGDLINFIDYRTGEGIVRDITGPDFVDKLIHYRTFEMFEEARRLWRTFASGREGEIAAQFDVAIDAAYRNICAAFDSADAYVMYGNVDRPDLLQRRLPANARFVDGDTAVIDGYTVGFASGGMPALNVPGEVGDDEMASKLENLGDVDVLCTHVPPAVPPLATDVVGGRIKGSVPVLEYVEAAQPAYHFFGDIHQPQALQWRVGDTICRNVGYFRATGRALELR